MTSSRRDVIYLPLNKFNIINLFYLNKREVISIFQAYNFQTSETNHHNKIQFLNNHLK